MARRIELPADSISMSSAMADKLLSKGSGDAALLYLYLLRHDGFYDPDEFCRTCQWNRTRLDAAMVLLGELGVATGEPVTQFHQPPTPTPAEAPDYSQEDLCQALEQNSEFSQFYHSVITLFNIPDLTDRDTKILLELYDHLDMPADVLLMLIDHEVNEYRRKHHSSVKNPPMTHIRTTAYNWKKTGVDTFDAAESYLERLKYFRSQEGELLNAVGIVGRSSVESESRFLRQWMDWGFSAESVHIAYERTLFHSGKMSWGYCNGILRRWHQAGLHTPEEIRLHDAPKRPTQGGTVSRAPAPAAPISAAEQAARDRAYEENQRQLQKLLDSM